MNSNMFINNSLSQQETCHSSWSTGADPQPRPVSWETDSRRIFVVATQSPSEGQAESIGGRQM